MIRDILDTYAALSFLVMGVVLIVQAATWQARIAYGLGTLAGLAIPMLLARRNRRRRLLCDLLADLALYDRRPEGHEDVPTFLLRLEHEVTGPLGKRLLDPVELDRVICVRVLLADYRKGKPS